MPPAIDLTGKRFGQLTCIEPCSWRDKDKCILWVVQCDCGERTFYRVSVLRAGHVRSCGCQQGSREDLVGRRFSRLVVIELAEAAHGKVRWRCRCDCGQTTVAFAHNLKNGNVQSCGCLRQQLAEARLSRFNRLAAKETEMTEKKQVEIPDGPPPTGYVWHRQPDGTIRLRLEREVQMEARAAENQPDESSRATWERLNAEAAPDSSQPVGAAPPTESMLRNRLELLLEDLECAHKWLDGQGVPRADVLAPFSLVGRMQQLTRPRPQIKPEDSQEARQLVSQALLFGMQLYERAEAELTAIKQADTQFAKQEGAEIGQLKKRLAIAEHAFNFLLTADIDEGTVSYIKERLAQMKAVP